MKRICNFARVTTISDEFLRESNNDLGLERAQLRFQFIGGGGKGASALVSSVDTSNGGSKLVDVSSQDGTNVPEKCRSLLKAFNDLASAKLSEIAESYGKSESELTDTEINSYRYPRFTTFTFDIAELGIIRDGVLVTIVNNGERNYPITSVTYLEDFQDVDSAKQIAKQQIEKRLNNGDYEVGSLDDDEDDDGGDNTDTNTNRNELNGRRNGRR